MISPVRQVQQLTAEERLRAAIRPYVVDEGPDLPPAPHEEDLLDAIMAAVVPILDAGTTVEWGFRRDGHVFGPYLREDYARAEHARQLGMGRTQDLMTRRATAWGVADV